MRTETITPKQKKEWNSIIKQLPYQDIFYLQEYNQLNAEVADYEAELFVYRKGDDLVAYPYLKKPIHVLPFFQKKQLKNKEKLYDITTLEYGGPQATSPDINFNEFREVFKTHCEQNGIVTEFARLHPFIANQPYADASTHIKDVYYIDLTKPMDVIWNNFKKSNRNTITKAKKEGIQVIKTSNSKDIKIFYNIYKQTMQRRNVRDFYYYSEGYFKKLFELLPDNVYLFIAYHDNKPIAGALFLTGNKTIHYYLAGRDINSRIHGSMNLILSKVIEWSKIDKYLTFNLGAGYEPGDSLSKFKSSFTKDFTSFRTHAQIHNKNRYKELETLWKVHKEIEPKDSKYFPTYRG